MHKYMYTYYEIINYNYLMLHNYIIYDAFKLFIMRLKNNITQGLS